MELGKRIHQLRLERGMSLEELGNKVGVGKSTVRKWEEGMIQNMRRDKIAKLANALGCSASFLMGWDEEVEHEPVAPQPYYLDDEARAAAEFLFAHPEYKVLFDASRKVKKEDIEFVRQMIERMSNND